MSGQISVAPIAEMTGLVFPSHIAEVYVQAKGRCEYCGRDLIQVRLAYGVIRIDHIIPRSKRPDNNLAFC